MKRAVSIMLAVMMTATMLPSDAYAAEVGNEVQYEENQDLDSSPIDEEVSGVLQVQDADDAGKVNEEESKETTDAKTASEVSEQTMSEDSEPSMSDSATGETAGEEMPAAAEQETTQTDEQETTQTDEQEASEEPQESTEGAAEETGGAEEEVETDATGEELTEVPEAGEEVAEPEEQQDLLELDEVTEEDSEQRTLPERPEVEEREQLEDKQPDYELEFGRNVRSQGLTETVESQGDSPEKTTITLKVKKGSDITEAVNEALEEARDQASDNERYTVRIPEGSYKISSQLRIYSNTTLAASGATITYSNSSKESHNMIMFGGYSYNTSSECKGYDGFKNITITGGKWVSAKYNTSTVMRIAHATNVELQGVTISGGGCSHQIEVAAVDGFKVDSCTFENLDYKKDSGSDKQEALQIDIPVADAVYPDIYQDGTVMKNVNISNCTFRNVPRGLGSHTMLMGAYHTNINITNNTFENIPEEAIIALNYYNCNIEGNTIKNCGAGVLYQFFKADTASIYTTAADVKYKNAKKVKHDAKATIKNNTITTKYNSKCDEIQGIKVYGVNLTKKGKGGDKKTVPAGNYYISDVKVIDNTITTAGHGIHLVNTQNCTVKGNKITGKNVSSKDKLKKAYDGIFLSTASKKNEIVDNTISNMVRNGIFLMDASSVSRISGCTISKCKNYGIGLFDGSKVTGDIYGNTMKSIDVAGISLSTKASAKNIFDNEISGTTKGTSINVWNKANVTGNIENNRIINNAQGKFAICVQKGSTVKGSISKNTIKKSGQKYTSDKAILINDKSTVQGSIKGNILGYTKTYGIMVSSSSKVGGIDSNEINKTGKSAILIDKKSTVAGKIQKNEIIDTSSNANAIHVTGQSTVTSSIYKNKILKKSNKYSCNTGILVYKSSNIKGGISGNTIKNTKGHGISVSAQCSSGAVKGNTIQNCGGISIAIYNSSKVTGTIADNKCKTVGNSGISVSASCSVKGAIASNTIEKTKECGITIRNNSSVKEISKNKITGAKGQGIQLAGIKNGITISGNSIKDGAQTGIFIQAGAAYKVIVKGNTVLAAKNQNAIYASTGYVVASGNTVSKKSNGIVLGNGVKGSVKKTKKK